jgi:hypothetical protein
MMSVEHTLERDVSAIGDPQSAVLGVDLLPNGGPSINSRLPLTREDLTHGPEEENGLALVAKKSRMRSMIVDEVP